MKSVILVGMPGSGKSTVGVLLAKELRRNFVDTDLLIQEHTGRGLQDILDHDGIPGFLACEEEVLLNFVPHGEVVATGGSVVYSEAGMEHLNRHGIVVYLSCAVQTLAHRLRNLDSRGVVRKSGQTVADLWAERDPLYRRWASITIPNDHDNHAQIVHEVANHPLVLQTMQEELPS
jgi:shikimate kinase